MFKLTVDPADAPDTPEKVTIGFEAGIPVAVNGEPLSPAALVADAERDRRTARRRPRRHRREPPRRHEVARRLRDARAARCSSTALKALESLTLDRDSAHEKERIATRYAELVYNGQWFSPLREALDAFVDDARGDRHRHRRRSSSTRATRRSSAARSPYSLYHAGPRLVRHDRLRRHRTRRASSSCSACSCAAGSASSPDGRRRSEAPRPRGAPDDAARCGAAGSRPEPSELLRALNDSFAFDRELFAEDVEGSIAWATASSARRRADRPRKRTRSSTALARARAGRRRDRDRPRGRALVRRGEAARSGRRARGQAAHRPLAQRPGRDRPETLAARRRRRSATRTSRISPARSRSAPSRRRRRRCPATRTRKQAEPVTFGHWCLAYVEMLQRDRLAPRGDARRAATSVRSAPARSPARRSPIDREALAQSPRLRSRRPRTRSTASPIATSRPSISSPRRCC